jgi:hypothetical protein
VDIIARVLKSRRLSTPVHKYGDVCWERDGVGVKARRRVDAWSSARRSNDETGPSRPNPAGGWGLPGDLFVVRRRRCHRIASSSLLDLAWQAPCANVTVFMDWCTKLGEYIFQNATSS